MKIIEFLGYYHGKISLVRDRTETDTYPELETTSNRIQLISK